MEIATDILIKKYNEYNSNYYQDFKKLNLLELVKNTSYDKFIKTIQQPNYLDNTKNFISQFIKAEQQDIIDVSKALLMSYAISAYPGDIFGQYHTNFDKSLILNANRLVLEIEESINNQIYKNNLNDSLDYFYSLYKVWESKESINEIEEIYDKMIHELKLINLNEKRNNNENNDIHQNNVITYLFELFNLNQKYTTKIILAKYNDMSDKTFKFEKYFWMKTEELYKHSSDIFFIILLSELRVHVIHRLKTPEERKDIYYTVDIEDIIYKIRNDELHDTDIKKIINIMQDKVSIINKNYQKKTVHINKKNNVVKIFRSLYNAIFL